MKQFSTLAILLFSILLSAQQVEVVPGSYVDLTYVASSDQLYALRTASTGGDGNGLCQIDPATAEVVSCLELDEEPYLLRATNSGNYLYLAFVQSNRVVRVDLSTQQIDQDFRLGGDGSLDRFSIRDLLPLRGSDDRLLVSSSFQCCDPTFEGVALVESGAVLQQATNYTLPTSLAYTADDRKIIGYDGYTGSYGLLAITIGDGDQLSTEENFGIQEYNGRLKYGGDNRIYSSGGSIISTDDTSPQLIAQVPLDYSFPSGGPSAVEPVLESGRIYYLGYNYNGQLSLAAYDASTLNLVITYNLLPNQQYGINQLPVLLQLAEPTSFAFLSFEGTVGLVTICSSLITEVPPPYTGYTTICQGDSLRLTAPEGLLAEGQTIAWSDGQVGDTVFVTQPGLYSYQVTDASGCPGPASEGFYVGTQDYLDAPPFVQEPMTDVLCAGATLQLFGSWYEPSTIVWNTGERADTLTVIQGGSYSARAINPNTGCFSEASPPIVIREITDSIPPAPVVDQGTTIDTCSLEPITLSVSQPALEYFWQINDYTFSNSRSTQIFYNFEPTVYSVSLRDFSGCISPATQVTVTYFQPPQPAVIQYNQTTNTLSARGTLGPVRWYRNDVFEAETQSLFYQPKQSGFYTARVRGERCLSEESNQVSVEGVISAVTNLENVVGIDIYPNPVHDQLNVAVDVPELRGRKLHYELVSVTGSLARSGQLAAVDMATPVSVADLAPGVYVLRLRDGAREVVRQRVVVF